MGVPVGGTTDYASTAVTGTLTATALVSQGIAATTGNSVATVFYGAFNVALSGTFSGTVQFEKSYDGGITWIALARDVSGTLASYALAWTAQSFNLTMCEIEPVVAWRIRCTAFTSGTLTYRLSQGGGLVFTSTPGIGG